MKLKTLIILAGISFSPFFASANMGCEDQDYMVGDSEASIAINGRGYTPRCLIVVVGSQVTIAASSRHPLAPQTTSNNPIPAATEPVTVQFTEPGEYGFFCTDHGDGHGEGMAGSIRAVESL